MSNSDASLKFAVAPTGSDRKGPGPSSLLCNYHGGREGGLLVSHNQESTSFSYEWILLFIPLNI